MFYYCGLTVTVILTIRQLAEKSCVKCLKCVRRLKRKNIKRLKRFKHQALRPILSAN